MSSTKKISLITIAISVAHFAQLVQAHRRQPQPVNGATMETPKVQVTVAQNVRVENQLVLVV